MTLKNDYSLDTGPEDKVLEMRRGSGRRGTQNLKMRRI